MSFFQKKCHKMIGPPFWHLDQWLIFYWPKKKNSGQPKASPHFRHWSPLTKKSKTNSEICTCCERTETFRFKYNQIQIQWSLSREPIHSLKDRWSLKTVYYMDYIEKVQNKLASQKRVMFHKERSLKTGSIVISDKINCLVWLIGRNITCRTW
jgi:hypothetical protein